MAVDDSYTKALLHMDGANGSTTFTDESGLTWLVNGTPSISTAQYKFGGASGFFDHNGSVYISGAVPDFNMSTGDWTVDTWIRPTAYTSLFAAIFVGGASWFPGSGGLYYYHADKKVGCAWNQLASLGNPLLVSGVITEDVWHHIALVRNGTDIRLYVDGQSVANKTLQASDSITFNNQDTTNIGGGTWDGANSLYYGNIDELRVSKGIARWTADFTPPDAPYAPPVTATEIISAATILTELTPGSAARASGALVLSEINPASAVKASGLLFLVEMLGAPTPTGIVDITIARRSTAATMRTKRKTYATLNERETALTLEERP